MASNSVHALVLPGARPAVVARSQGTAAGAARRVKTRSATTVYLSALACIAAAHAAMADPAAAAPRACEVASPQDAMVLADRFFEKREYQHAGVCYQAAGDMVHANLAFLKAAEPQSEDTARDLRAQRETAKALFARVGSAFRSGH